MNRFEPLGYVAASITIWHWAIIGALLGLLGVVAPLLKGASINWSWFPFGFISLLSIYAIFALLFGQVFGDKYPFGMIYPSGLIVGALFCSLPFFGSLLGRAVTSDQPPAAFIAIALFVGANFFAFGLWLLPRIVGFGVIDLPRFSWGVKILP